MNQPIIEVRQVEKTYRVLIGASKKALDGIDLGIQEGEVFGLIGPNGAGKTTLLTCLLGFLRPDRGDIRVDGRPPDDLTVRERTGYLPERLGFDRQLTGRRFLALHARLAGVPPGEVDSAVRQGAERVELAEEALARPLKTYSRGMLQRIGLAQALLGSPDLLFLDEPASGMDPAGVVLLRSQILEAKARGATVVLNSHQLHEVERVCDRVAFIVRGRVERIEVLRGERRRREDWSLRVRPGHEEEAQKVLETAGLSAEAMGPGLLRLELEPDDVERVAPLVVGAGLALRELTRNGAGLEQLFFNGDGGSRA